MLYIFLLLTALIQTTLLNLIAFGNIKPDLLLIFVVFIAFNKGAMEGAKIGLWAGFLKDALSAGPYLNMLNFAILGFLIGLFSRRFYKDRLVNQIFVTAAAAIFVSIIYLSWLSQQEPAVSLASLALWVGLPSILYSALTAPFVFLGLNKILSNR